MIKNLFIIATAAISFNVSAVTCSSSEVVNEVVDQYKVKYAIKELFPYALNKEFGNAYMAAVYVREFRSNITEFTKAYGKEPKVTAALLGTRNALDSIEFWSFTELRSFGRVKNCAFKTGFKREKVARMIQFNLLVLDGDFEIELLY